MEKPENMQILQYFQNGRRYHGLWSHGHMKILSVFRIRVPTFLHLDPDPGGKGAKNTGKI